MADCGNFQCAFCTELDGGEEIRSRVIEVVRQTVQVTLYRLLEAEAA